MSEQREQIALQMKNGPLRRYPWGTTVAAVSRDETSGSRIVAAMVNNEMKDLRFPLAEDSTVEFIDLYSEAGIKVYQRSLAFVLITAAAELFPDVDVTVEHSLSKGLYCELHRNGREVTAADVGALEDRMRYIIAEDRAIIHKRMSRQEAGELFAKAGQAEKSKLLMQMDMDHVDLYYCGLSFDYFYEILVPSTGYLGLFELKYYPPGIILRFPTQENPHVLPPFEEHPKLAKVFLEAEQWGRIMGCGYVSDLNEHIRSGQISDVIQVAEALHEKKIAHIADYIAERRGAVRVILIAGPSSSGKTTFAQRLTIQLRVNGLRPVSVSLDDYFVDRHRTPMDENGDYDFEAIEAIDLALFNDHLIQLLASEEVEIPYYNFVTGRRERRDTTVRISRDQPLIIEGIHGLNERLTASVARENKVKIYISALTQLSIDNHNRIPTTDTRLIRRLVRDSKFRSHDAVGTLKMWPSVRRGEERHIFPFQEEADIMFNSALIYELAVLKQQAVTLLENVDRREAAYSEARRLLSFLAYFCAAGPEHIPLNSIMREFIGS